MKIRYENRIKTGACNIFFHIRCNQLSADCWRPSSVFSPPSFGRRLLTWIGSVFYLFDRWFWTTTFSVLDRHRQLVCGRFTGSLFGKMVGRRSVRPFTFLTASFIWTTEIFVEVSSLLITKCDSSDILGKNVSVGEESLWRTPAGVYGWAPHKPQQKRQMFESIPVQCFRCCFCSP